MAACKTLNTFLQQLRKQFSDCIDPPESHSRQSRIADIERAERAEREALIHQAERLCSSQEAHKNAVLERLGLSIQQDNLPSPHPPASPRCRPESSLPGRRIRPIVNLPPLKLEEKNPGRKSGTNQLLDEDDPFFEQKLRLGSHMAILACKLAKVTARNKSPSPDGSVISVDSLNTVDTHTTSELRAISKLGSPVTPRFTPNPPKMAATMKKSCLPPRAGTKVADECPRQSATIKVKKTVETLEQCQLVRRPPHQPAVPPKRTTLAPVPPSAAVPAKTRGPRRGTNLRPPKADRGQVKDDIKPLAKASESLSLCFRQLASEDWEKKMEGLKTVRALARYHPELLQPKLHEICLILEEEVKNLRSSVACAAMDSIAELHLRLGKAMDPESDRTGRALLLKLAQTTSTFIHQQANLALDALVEGCSPSRVVSALLNTGLSHRCAAVRASTAQHLHQLATIIGVDQTLTAGKTFAERFVSAVTKMTVDAAPEVRLHGMKMLEGLVHQRDFMALWDKVVPVKDRRPLEKILKKMRQ
ncbi:uncharacterized protein LOC108881720 [Lates calcarifer]|uniref:Uncharacterized protein LOC108881720 n=1 Tax=Lates calcarifer TaxID=8187 RepID=A0AAJ7LSH5_LATCA|nr:uncharacterized protein LOC108881720 [Lates calcarifer]